MREYWVNIYTSYISTINHFSREDAIEGSRSIYSGEQLASYRIHVIPKLPKAPQLETPKSKYEYGCGLGDWKQWKNDLDKPFRKPLTENKDILDTLFPTDD